MANSGSYIEELEAELKSTDVNSHANRLITQEMNRLTKGEEDSKETKERPIVPVIELHNERPQKCCVKVRIPVKEFPKYNFVGKLLGPKGATLKAMQDQTGCKMAIMGKGSMREKEKEEECRKQGGKYAHLNEELHVLVECFCEPVDGYHRLAAALVELRKFMVPEMNNDGYGGGDAMGQDMGINNGAPRGRGGFRGAPPERGRGGFRGRGSGPAPPQAPARGGPAGRGGPPRGGPRGGPAVARGGPASRGGAPPPARGGRAPAPPASYEGYGSQQSYSESGYNGNYGSSYDDGYGYGQESSYYHDYGQSGSGAGSYDSYSGGYGDYSEGWSNSGAGAAGAAGGGKAPVAPSRGASRGGPSRAHPYSRPGASATSY